VNLPWTARSHAFWPYFQVHILYILDFQSNELSTLIAIEVHFRQFPELKTLFDSLSCRQI